MDRTRAPGYGTLRQSVKEGGEAGVIRCKGEFIAMYLDSTVVVT